MFHEVGRGMRANCNQKPGHPKHSHSCSGAATEGTCELDVRVDSRIAGHNGPHAKLLRYQTCSAPESVQQPTAGVLELGGCLQCGGGARCEARSGGRDQDGTNGPYAAEYDRRINLAQIDVSKVHAVLNTTSEAWL